jgi:hypothetical protein
MGHNPACYVVHPPNLACDPAPASNVLVDGSEVCNGSNRRGQGMAPAFAFSREETLSP